jgi:hypothetical protein
VIRWKCRYISSSTKSLLTILEGFAPCILSDHSLVAFFFRFYEPLSLKHQPATASRRMISENDALRSVSLSLPSLPLVDAGDGVVLAVLVLLKGILERVVFSQHLPAQVDEGLVDVGWTRVRHGDTGVLRTI